MSLAFQKHYAQIVTEALARHLGDGVTAASVLESQFKGWFQKTVAEAIQAELQLIAADKQANQPQNVAQQQNVQNNPKDTGNSAQQAAAAAEKAGAATEAGQGTVQ